MEVYAFVVLFSSYLMIQDLMTHHKHWELLKQSVEDQPICRFADLPICRFADLPSLPDLFSHRSNFFLRRSAVEDFKHCENPALGENHFDY
jgi:hypothetical protein